jgi:hypothetical protein
MSPHWLNLQPDLFGSGQDAWTTNYLDHHKGIRPLGQTQLLQSRGILYLRHPPKGALISSGTIPPK